MLLLPTAYTHPQGTVFVSNYEMLVFQVGYALTDWTQISLTALPLASESLTVLDLSLKTAVVRTDLVRAAAIGSVSGVVGDEIGAVFLGRVGGVAQLCFGRRCDSSLSLSSNVALAGPLMLMVNGVGGILRASEHVSFIGELSTMVPLGTVGGEFNGGLAGGGVRLHYDHWAFDFSLLHVLESDTRGDRTVRDGHLRSSRPRDPQRVPNARLDATLNRAGADASLTLIDGACYRGSMRLLGLSTLLALARARRAAARRAHGGGGQPPRGGRGARAVQRRGRRRPARPRGQVPPRSRDPQRLHGR